MVKNWDKAADNFRDLVTVKERLGMLESDVSQVSDALIKVFKYVFCTQHRSIRLLNMECASLLVAWLPTVSSNLNYLSSSRCYVQELQSL